MLKNTYKTLNVYGYFKSMEDIACFYTRIHTHIHVYITSWVCEIGYYERSYIHIYIIYTHVCLTILWVWIEDIGSSNFCPNLKDLVDIHVASSPVHVSVVHTLLHLLIYPTIFIFKRFYLRRSVSISSGLTNNIIDYVYLYKPRLSRKL